MALLLIPRQEATLVPVPVLVLVLMPVLALVVGTEVPSGVTSPCGN